jgi:hypothetical protein
MSTEAAPPLPALPTLPGSRQCIFVRHGATACMDESFRIVRMVRDDPLSEVGQAQADALQPLAAAIAAAACGAGDSGPGGEGVEGSGGEGDPSGSAGTVRRVRGLRGVGWVGDGMSLPV